MMCVPERGYISIEVTLASGRCRRQLLPASEQFTVMISGNPPHRSFSGNYFLGKAVAFATPLKGDEVT